MGLKSSPYQAIQGVSIAEEVIRGDWLDRDNPFYWDEVILNLSGSPDYDPARPWVFKIRTHDGCIACEILIFVDDIRITGPTRWECWRAGQRVAKILTYLGLQDAARKTRDALRDPGPWAGTILNTEKDGVFCLISAEKWMKMRRLLYETKELIVSAPKQIPRKRLKQIRGFLQYVVTTYPSLTPYLIGFHLTIDGWREDRDEEGWRIPGHKQRSRTEWSHSLEVPLWEESDSVSSSAETPELVAAAPRFTSDVDALLHLTNQDLPPLRCQRCLQTAEVHYGFGDASKPGFGAAIQVGDIVHFEYSQWCTSDQEESSNWCKLNNLVEALERQVTALTLRDCEVFIFTDNTTAEAAFWKGYSSSKRLSALVLRLRKLEMQADIILHITHVSG